MMVFAAALIGLLFFTFHPGLNAATANEVKATAAQASGATQVRITGGSMMPYYWNGLGAYKEKKYRL